MRLIPVHIDPVVAKPESTPESTFDQPRNARNTMDFAHLQSFHRCLLT
jgi:hypothetical protein